MIEIAVTHAAPRPATRRDEAPPRVLAAVSDDGRCTVATDGEGVRLVGGPALVDARCAVAAAVLEHAIWIVAEERGEHALHRFDRDGQSLGGPVALGALGADVRLSAVRRGPVVAWIEGERGALVRERRDGIDVEPLGERGADRRVLLGARGVAERRGRGLALRHPGSAPLLALPADLLAATIGAGGLVLDGSAALIEVVLRDRATALVYDLRSGEVRSRIRLGAARVLATAERAGIVVLGSGPHIALLDLRAGRCVGERILAAPAAAAAIDASGQRVVCLDVEGHASELGRGLVDAGSARTMGDEPSDASDGEPAAATTGAEPSDPDAEPSVDTAPSATTTPSGALAPSAAPAPSAASGASAATAPVPGDHPGAAPTNPPTARPRLELRTSPQVAASPAAPAEPQHLGALGQPPYPVLAGPDLEQYLDVTRRWIVCLCHTAIAIAPATSGAAPAAELVARARATERAASEAFAGWSDRGSPHVELAVELGLSPMATTILLIAAAPQIWGELARTYGQCTADPARPLVDELLLAHLLEATTATRAAIARELDDDAPLVRSGAIEVGRGLRPYAAITVHPAIARRLAGAPVAGDPGPATTPHELAELIGPRAAIDALARTLVAPRVEPVRVVLRGRPAAGRRTIAAALAALAGRRIGLVDGSAEPAVLRARLRDVTLRGDLPCATLDQLSEDPASHAQLRAILDAHPGPLFVRAPLGGDLPLAPGYAALELPSPSETERRAAWREILRRHALAPAIADELAARFSVGPGAIHRACAAVVAAGETGPTAAVAITAALRQHRAARIEAIATRVDRLAAWEDLIVSPEIDDALRELIARVSHRRTVLEEWGMDRVAATAQGVTALLQGGPGTGKTLAAGAIARALGYELWRVDLSKVLSKWIGETEKNLAAVFDAAEDGEIVLLFDEADSLFGRRTTSASSQDRHANVKTNYLLQRLDSFSGIAILTTNLGTAIDPAFRRRLSVQIQFPFPDAGDRERLWRAHLPRSLPIEGELDLGELARRHQLSGGYIRNAALRAAYLAAAERRALSADHLRRAVALEYQRAGKLGDGRLE